MTINHSFGRKFEHPVAHRLCKRMVMCGQKHRAFVVFQGIVKGRNRLQVQVIGRLVQKQHIGAAHHHFREHTAHFFTSRQYVGLFECFFTTEQHFAQKAANEHFLAFLFGLGILPQPVDQRHGLLEVGRIVERQIGLCGGHPPLKRPSSRGGTPCNNLVKGRHGTAVFAIHHDLVALGQIEVQVLKQHIVVQGGLEAFNIQNLIPGLALLLKYNRRITATRGFNFGNVEFVDHFLSRSRLLGLSYIGRKTGNEFLQFLFLFLGFFVLLRALACGQLARFVPKGVVAREVTDFTKVNIGNMGTHSIQKVTVVRDHNHGMVIVRQKLLQPQNGFVVQIVGRLIHNEHIGVAKEGLRQQHPHFLHPVQIGHLGVVQAFVDAQIGQQGRGIALGVPAVHFFKLNL